ncbi:hypothetical protein HY522_09620 [bacterium]|nr:hypothetical protein [bacterium]
MRKGGAIMDFTPEELREYREALRDRICSICRKFGYDEVCGIGEDGECPFDRHLPKLLDAVLTTPRSDQIADYIPKIRELVCSTCPNQNDRGVCKSRDMAYCGLDSFLVLVVQVIEETYDRLRPQTRPADKRAAA